MLALRFLATSFVLSAALRIPTSSESVAQGKIRLTCIGDSLTSGTDGITTETAYPAKLQTLLGEKYEVASFGRRALTVSDTGTCGVGGGNLCGNDYQCRGGGNCAFMNTELWTQALESKPDIVTIMLGTNDGKGCDQDLAIRAGFAKMILQLKTLPSKPKIYLVTPPPVTAHPQNQNCAAAWGIKKDVVNGQIQAAVHGVGQSLQVPVIDVWSKLGGKEFNVHDTVDGVHMNEDVHQKMATILAEAVHPILTFF